MRMDEAERGGRGSGTGPGASAAKPAKPQLPATQQFNVYLPPALIRRAKYRALDAQSSLSDFVERALVAYLDGGDRHG